MNANRKCLAGVSRGDKAPAALAEAALTYVRERGWPIFPITPMGKTPLLSQNDGGNGVLDATTDERQIREWWSKYPKANIGLDVGGAGMMALDLDPGHDLAELQRAIGRLPDTRLRQSTPRGGKHLFYALNEGEIVAASASKLAPHVDVRSFHSYVLLAPSKTSDGAYTWEFEDWPTPKPAHRTDEMLRLANVATQKSKGRDDWLIEPDMALHVERAKDWLRNTAKPAIMGQGGDHTAYATAAMMKSFGIAPETALDLIVEHWNPRCIPPWGEDELGHLTAKVEHAYRYNTSPPGNVTDAYRVAKVKAMFQPVPLSANGTPDWPEGLYNGPTIANRPEAKWIIPGVVQETSYSVASGRSQAGKSFNELALALSIATGKPWLGIEVKATGPVLYIAAEGQSRIESDMRAWCTHFGVGFDSLKNRFFVYDRSARLNTEEGTKALRSIFSAIEHAAGRLPIYAVFDTLRRNMRGGVSQEEPTSDVLHAVNEIQTKAIAVTLIAHHGRGHGETKGLTEWEDDADQVRHYDGTVRDGTTKVTFAKVKSDKDDWSLKVDYAEVILPSGKSTLVAAKGIRIERDQPARQDHSTADRATAALAILKALRNGNANKKWRKSELAEAARAQGCTIPHRTLGENVLGAKGGKPGWARSDPFLAPYFNRNREGWETPLRSKMPPWPVQLGPECEAISEPK